MGNQTNDATFYMRYTRNLMAYNKKANVIGTFNKVTKNDKKNFTLPSTLNSTSVNRIDTTNRCEETNESLTNTTINATITTAATDIEELAEYYNAENIDNEHDSHTDVAG